MKLYLFHGSPIPNIRKFSLENAVTDRKNVPFFENIYGVYFLFTDTILDEENPYGPFVDMLRNYALKKSTNGKGYLYTCTFDVKPDTVLSNKDCTLSDGELLQICTQFNISTALVDAAHHLSDELLYYRLCSTRLGRETISRFYVDVLGKTCVMRGNTYGTIIVLKPEDIAIENIEEITKH